jgi:hypothetical protein
MLHFKTVDSATLELLKKLMKLPALSEKRLVGGTSLALQTGYRKSDDLDLFGPTSVDESELSKQFTGVGESVMIHNTANIHIWRINGIKVDIVDYPYEWISKCKVESGIRLAGKEDIAAMKLSAITGRGSKKDFYDIYFLLKEFSLEQMLQFYKKKYPQGTLFLVLKSLAYFGDADENFEPTLIKHVFWKDVKTSVISEIDRYYQLNKRT